MNVEEVLNSKGISYRESGNDFMVRCLNPEHDDSNPIMRIDKIIGIFNCWSCGYKGNIFHLYKVESNKLGILREQLKRKIRKSVVLDPLDLPEDAISYTQSYRGLSTNINKKFNLFTTNSLGLEDRLVIPITDKYNNIYAFIGRDLYGALKKKYLFYPAYSTIRMFPVPTFKMGRLILVEGIFDAFNLIDNGITNVSCIFGTSNVSEDDLTLLEMSGLTKLIIMLDSDDAGQKGARRIIELCKKITLDYENIVLDEKDPGELSKEDLHLLKQKLYV